jgi:hypothetical protein
LMTEKRSMPRADYAPEPLARVLELPLGTP